MLFPDLPKFDNSALIAAEERKGKAESDAEKMRLSNIKRKKGGYAGTILTGGQGLEEEAPVAQTMLGGSSNTDRII